MLKILFKPEAEEDISKIFKYTFYKWGLKQAEKYNDELIHGIEQIAQHKSIGKIYPYSVLSYRQFHVNRHLIFYRIEGRKCIIVRILHDRFDIKNHLK